MNTGKAKRFMVLLGSILKSAFGKNSPVMIMIMVDIIV